MPDAADAVDLDRLEEEAQRAAREAHAARERVAAEQQRRIAEREQRAEQWDRDFVAAYNPGQYADDIRQARARMVADLPAVPGFSALIDYFTATHIRYAAAVAVSSARERLGERPTLSGAALGREDYVEMLGTVIRDAVMDRVDEFNTSIEQARVDHIQGDGRA